ncbi:MAG TPA: hypothetical protein VK581_11950, partial [Chthoniobacterales bacterium]|nr:hypothetical protein [Chthoniobacterales bacterium]
MGKTEPLFERAIGHGGCFVHSVEMLFVSRPALRLIGYASLLAVFLAPNSTSCFAQSFLPVASTPYDHQMAPISGVLNSPTRHLARQTSLIAINQWMIHLRAIPYQYSIQWKTPAQVRSALAADCKGKAMMLYAKMRANGATNVRVVIGKHNIADMRTHAWLEWDTAAGTLLLDPTFNRAVERATEHDSTMYIPLYAYNGACKYRANYYQPSYVPVVASNEAIPT